MIALIENMSKQRAEELRAEGARRRLAARGRRRGPSSSRRRSDTAGAVADYAARISGYGARLTIRRLDRDADREAIERVAGRDTSAVPEGELLGAELEGGLVAAISTTTGRTVADPFAPTAEAVLLLRRRAEQLRAARGRRRRRVTSRLLRRSAGRAG